MYLIRFAGAVCLHAPYTMNTAATERKAANGSMTEILYASDNSVKSPL